MIKHKIGENWNITFCRHVQGCRRRGILRSKIKHTNLHNFDEIKHGVVTILAYNEEFKLILPYYQVQEPLVAVTMTGLRMTWGKNVLSMQECKKGHLWKKITKDNIFQCRVSGH